MMHILINTPLQRGVTRSETKVGTRSVMEKNLDALARESKLKTNGKQMLAALEKAGLI